MNQQLKMFKILRDGEITNNVAQRYSLFVRRLTWTPRRTPRRQLYWVVFRVSHITHLRLLYNQAILWTWTRKRLVH